MKNTAKLLAIASAGLINMTSGNVVAAEEGHHPNHLAVAGGIAWHDSKNSGFLGVDYLRYRDNGWGYGGFYEEVSGDFDLQVWGFLFSRDFGNGFKFNFGPGVERKIEKDKTLLLFRFQGGYFWHSGNWSYGPVFTVDWIEDDNTTGYAGLSLGYGW